MFWGVVYGWEVATGYPWGFWKGGDYDLLKEGTRALRQENRETPRARQ